MKYIYKLFLLLLILFCINLGFAQNEISSPYSGFGIGKLSSGTSVTSQSMGGISYAIQNPYFVNFKNPASYGAFDSLTFLADASFYALFTTLRKETKTQKNNSVRPAYLAIGLPVTRHWRTSVGVLPFSDLGYTILNSKTDEHIGKISYTYKGNGGLIQLFWGNAFQLYKGLSVGINTSYLFGHLATTRIAEIEGSNYFNSAIDNSLNVNGIYLSGGVQYFFNLKEKHRIGLGAIYENSLYLSVRKNETVTIFQGRYENMIGQDIISNINGKRGRMIIPQSIGAGTSYHYANRFLIGLDATWHQWEKFKLMNQSDSLKNSWEIKGGVQFTPNPQSNKYLKRISIRTGVKYSTGYFIVDGKTVDEYTLAFGLGLPLKGISSNHAINILFEYGQLGSLQKNIIAENFIRLSVNFILHEKWYQRVKLD